MKSRALQRSASGTPDGRALWTRRVILGGLGTAGASIALAALAASAFANAANPISTSATVSPPDANGHVTVTVSGRWSWGELGTTQSSPQNDCAGRSGVGWSVDWWGMSTSQTAKANPPALTGSLVNPTTSKTTPPSPTSGALNPTQVWQVKSGASTGLYFHTTQDFNGFEANLCPKTAADPNGNPDITLDGKGAPSGSWSASAIYPSASDVPPLICANFYDPHGSRGSFSTSTSDNTTADGDNSIKTNNFDPANVQGNCAVPVVQNALSISVVKSNDASGDGTFSTSPTTEQANSLTQNVPFKVVVKNTSAADTAVIQSGITDSFNGTTINVCDGSLGSNVVSDDNIVGVELAPNASTTCTFTLKNYVPATGSITNTVTVTAKDKQAPAITASDHSSSIVVAPPPPVLKVTKDGPATGTPGGSGDYTITLTNTSTQVSAGGPITFYDQLPTGESLLPGAHQVDAGGHAVTPNQITCASVVGNASLVQCTYAGSLAPQASVKVDVPILWASNVDGQTLTDCAGLTAADAGNGSPDPAHQCVPTKFPNLTITKDGPGSGVPGGNGSYLITVKNHGPAPATAVSFVDQLPADESFVSAAGGDFNCTVDPNDATKINCTAKTGLLPLGVNQTLSVNVLVTYALTSSEGEHLTDCAILPNHNQDCATTIIHKPDVTILKTGPATGTAGGNGLYTITVKNTGQATADNVAFTDQLPVGESYVSFSSSTITCSLSGNSQIVNCSVNGGSLAPGASASVDVTIAYGANTGGQTLTDCAILMTGNQSCVPTKIPSPPSISVVKTNDANGDGVFHDTEQADAPGDPVTFKVVITNTSVDPLTIDSVSDVWPGLANALAECPQLIGTVLQSGDSVTCTFTVDNYAPAAGDSLTNTITVGGHQTPGGTRVTGTDTSTVTTKVPSPIDLAIVKDADKATVKVGNTLTYTLAVSNVGQGATTGPVTVTDTIPDGLDPVSVSGGTAWDCTLSGRDISCTYLNGALSPGEAAPLITVVTTVNSTAVGVVINTGIVDTPGDVNPANNHSTVKTPVIKVLPLKVIKTPPAVLPFTGDRTGAMLPVGILTVLAGALLMVTGRRRRRTN